MKNYLVIGASSGIGKALFKQLRDEGNRVFGTYLNSEPEDKTDMKRFDAVMEEFDPSYLPDSLDGFAYCPGSINLKPFKRLKKSEIQEDLDLQVLGAVSVLQSILPRLTEADSASIVFFSTVAVQHGFNLHSQVAISKGALEGLTKTLAAEFAPKIRVNAIAPSLTDTPLASKLLNSYAKKAANAERHPLKRIGTAEDIAEMASFLLSDKSSWISGQIISVDGGMSSIRF